MFGSDVDSNKMKTRINGILRRLFPTRSYRKDIERINKAIEPNWIDIKVNQPEPLQFVYVVVEIPKYGGGVIGKQTIAQYVPKWTIKEEDFMREDFHGDGDYNEKEDEYYTPEGFYEWQVSPDINWKLSEKVTYWMPLMELPKIKHQ